MSILLKYRDSYFRKYLTEAPSEIILPSALGINFKIRMNSIFLPKKMSPPSECCLTCMFVDTIHQSPKVIRSPESQSSY